MGSFEPTLSFSKGSSLNCIIFFVPTNVYGHPHEEVVDGIAEAGVILLRTDEMGAVEIKKKNKKIVVSGYAGQEKSK